MAKPAPKEGIGVDSVGNPSVDPSGNVKALSEASNKRQDDLREANDKLTQSQMQCLKENAELRADHARELNAAESRRIAEQLQIRSEYADKLSVAEAKRIDAIRAVDVNAVAVASQRASDQATVLATQVAQSAEALRSLVASTAVTVNQSQQQLATTLSTRITTLEQAQYEGKGKQAFADPQMIELMAEMKAMRGTKSEGVSASWGVLLGVATLVAVVVGVATFALNRPQTPAYLSAPPTNIPTQNNVPR